MTVNGSLGSVAGVTADLDGDVHLIGTLGKLALRGVTGPSTITVDTAGAASTFAFKAPVARRKDLDHKGKPYKRRNDNAAGDGLTAA